MTGHAVAPPLPQRAGHLASSFAEPHVVTAPPGLSTECRQRDIFPLPVGEGFVSLLTSGRGAISSHSKRFRRHFDHRHWLDAGIRSLNELAGVGGSSSSAQVTQTQQHSIELMSEHYASVHEAVGVLEPVAAWNGLLRAKGRYQGGEASLMFGSSSRYRKGAVKFPPGVAGGTSISIGFSADLSKAYETGHGILLPNVESIRPSRPPAIDPVFRRVGKAYGDFLHELWSINLVSPIDSDEVGFVCVPRKDGQQRLIFDLVQLNDSCRSPPTTRLPSAASLSSIESEHNLTQRSADANVCFYQYWAPLWLKRRLVLPPIRLKYLPQSMWHLFPDAVADIMVHLTVSVLPMGWIWAMHLVNIAQGGMLKNTSDAPWLLDKLPCAPLRRSEERVVSLCSQIPVDGEAPQQFGAAAAAAAVDNASDHIRFLYVDNYVSIATSLERATSVRDCMVTTLDEAE